MKPFMRVYFYLLLLVLFITGCTNNEGEFPKTGDVSSTSPAETSISGVRVWGDAPNTETPVPTSALPQITPTPLPPTSTTTDVPTEIPISTSHPENPITTLLFTGAIVPGRCVQAAVDEYGNADFLYTDVKELISEADIAVGTLNAALSDFPPHKGCIETFVLVGSSNNADAMAAAGFDVMSVATNHIKNCGLTSCGDRAFLDTMDNLERVEIQAVGAGNNLSEAMQPVVVERNGIRFGFVSLGEIESMAFASEDSPGIAPLPDDFAEADENLRISIAAAKEISDVVIVMPHWGSDYQDIPNYRQLHFDQVIVDAGADLVIGNHSHWIQGMREIDDIPVFYSLGSFVFDQDWSVKTQQGIVVRVTFQGTEILGYEVIPVHIDGNGHVQVAGPEEAADILARFQEISNKIR